jgi:hypothetical protein
MRNRGDWQKLDVKISIGIKPRTVFSVDDILSKTDRKRIRLTAAINLLEGKHLPTGTILNRVFWRNPDAEHEVGIDKPSEDWIQDAKKGLQTLNRGGWLSKALSRELTALGGPLTLEGKPTGKRQKKARKKAHRKAKKVVNVGRKKRKATGKVSKVGGHRRAA